MGLFGAVKSGLKKVGGLAEKVAPFAGLIPGVGTIAGGAIGGLGALAHGDGLGGALKYGAEGALSGYGGSKLLGGKGVMGIPQALGKGGSLSGLKKIGGQAAGLVAGHGGGGLGSLLDYGLAGGGLLAGANASRNAGKQRDEALKLVKGQWEQGAPLRAAGIAGMLNTQRPDLSSTFANPQNPFMRKVG